MKTAIIFHGTLGSPSGNWFQWLLNELEKKGFTVWLPQLPNAEKPCLSGWRQFVERECPFPINEETLIVGHSSGAILALVVAQEVKGKIGAIVGVSVFHDNSLEWTPNDELFDIEFDWDAIKQNVNKIVFIHSDDDSYVPLNQAEYVAVKTDAEMTVIPGEGHFNLEQSDTYAQFPKLLKVLEEREFV